MRKPPVNFEVIETKFKFHGKEHVGYEVVDEQGRDRGCRCFEYGDEGLAQATAKCDELKKQWGIITPEVGEYAMQCYYTDVVPWEIIAISKSGKSITVRIMDTERITDPEFIVGGFAGHCTNNRSVEYKYISNESNSTITLRVSRKHGWGKGGQKFVISSEPYKFYDYNF